MLPLSCGRPMISRAASTERLFAAALLAAALLIHGPLFLRAPLGPDPVMYDLQAGLIQDGGVLYRDILEPNLPGVVWVHGLVRSCAGWSPEALRAFDLLWFCLAAWLATRLMKSDPWTSALVAVVMVTGYTTLSEWCHCQRDVWMLPFVIGAMLIRVRRQEARLLVGVQPLGCSRQVKAWTPTRAHSLWASDSSAALKTSLLSAFAEGALWGCAVWLKPHVVVPAACVVAAAGFVALRRSGHGKRQLAEEGCVAAGGALIGLVGVLWLIQHNAWQPLWSMLTEWNRDYVAAAASRWSWARLWSIQERLAPWSVVHLAAIPVSAWMLWRAVRPADGRSSDACATSVRRILISALYLGWIAQTLLLQHLFDYVHVPALVLGSIVVAMLPWAEASIQWARQRAALASVAILALAILVRGDQLALWPRCLHEQSSPSLHAALARLPLPEWNHLAIAEQFLREQNVRDGELTAYHTHTIHLYPALKVRPSTRFVFTETHLRLFPGRTEEIARTLRTSRQRFVVSDLIEAGLDPAMALDDSDPDNWRTACPQDALAAFPFDQPVVFRSGPYLVHVVTQPLGPVETGFFPLAAKSAGL